MSLPTILNKQYITGGGSHSVSGKELGIQNLFTIIGKLYMAIVILLPLIIIILIILIVLLTELLTWIAITIGKTYFICYLILINGVLSC